MGSGARLRVALEAALYCGCKSGGWPLRSTTLALLELLFERDIELARFAWLWRPESVDEFDEVVERQRIGDLLVRAARFVDQVKQAAGQTDRGELRIAAAGFQPLDGVDSSGGAHDGRLLIGGKLLL